MNDIYSCIHLISCTESVEISRSVGGNVQHEVAMRVYTLPRNECDERSLNLKNSLCPLPLVVPSIEKCEFSPKPGTR